MQIFVDWRSWSSPRIRFLTLFFKFVKYSNHIWLPNCNHRIFFINKILTSLYEEKSARVLFIYFWYAKNSSQLSKELFLGYFSNSNYWTQYEIDFWNEHTPTLLIVLSWYLVFEDLFRARPCPRMLFGKKLK